MQNIDKLQPGPELDALIAEHIFGQSKPTTDPESLAADGIPLFEIGRDSVWYPSYSVASGVRERSRWAAPPYSTNIEAALSINRPGWLWAFSECGSYLIISILGAKLSENGDRIPLGDVKIIVDWDESETRGGVYALAICRAALKVVEMVSTRRVGMTPDRHINRQLEQVSSGATRG